MPALTTGHTLVLALALAALLPAATGCASPSPTTTEGRGEKARQALSQFRNAVTRGVADCQAADTALTDLGALAGDMQERFDTFTYAIATVEKDATAARTRADELKTMRAVYLEQWKKELEESKDPDLRARQEAARADIAADFDRVRQASDAVRDAYRPWIEDMRAIRDELAKQYTPSSVVAQRQRAAGALGKGAVLRTQLQVLLAEMDRMARMRAARIAN